MKLIVLTVVFFAVLTAALEPTIDGAGGEGDDGEDTLDWEAFLASLTWEHGISAQLACTSVYTWRLEILPKHWRCDGIEDCVDFEDEIGCHACVNGAHHCYTDLECFPRSFRCDGEEDCIDGSDEEDCTSEELDKEGESICFIDGKKDYIPDSWFCDGIRDCDNYKDEIDCDECGESGFLCEADSMCIDIEWECDGIVDCSDEADEHCAEPEPEGEEPLPTTAPPPTPEPEDVV